MARLAYYLFLKPLSHLPIRLLYVLSELLFILIYYIIQYRKAVVRLQLSNSFPEKSHSEIKAIEIKFYRHFADLIVESIRLFSISRKEVIARCKALNPELINAFYDQGRHIILVGGHYNNWEMLAVALDSQVKHKITGIYSPLTNPFFDKVFAKSRTRFGTELVAKSKVAAYFNNPSLPLKATVFGADQSPQFIKDNTYWTTFMNQDTPVMFGVEKYAVQNQIPVVFVHISKPRRGYYEMEFSLIEDNPAHAEYCEITEKHTRILEGYIKAQPEFYLWTHKRWKHRRNKIG